MIFSVVVLLFLISFSTKSATCDKNSPITGFSKVLKSAKEKVFFYKKPTACKETAGCTIRKKSFLVAADFVQIGKLEGDFACALYRNFNGHGGKITVGWLLVSELGPIRKKLDRSDLVGSWSRIPCNDNDDCTIEIEEDEKKILSVSLNSHFNQRPAESLSILSVKETPGQLILACQPGIDCKQFLSLDYDSNDLQPGTIKLLGSETFEGVYRK